MSPAASPSAPCDTDRRGRIAVSATVNGIDYVQVAPVTIAGASPPNRAVITVVFLNGVNPGVNAAALTGGSKVPSVPVTVGAWTTGTPGTPSTLPLTVTPPDDPSTYTLQLTGGAALDPYFSHTTVSFVAGTPTTVDCETPPAAAPASTATLPPIDYLSKDFASFENALLGFSALRYPAWQERSEADFGVMFMEALCSLADDFSYQQDRISAEAYLDTATERRSLVRLARLVAYEPQPALAATVMLQLDWTSTTTTTIPVGLAVGAGGPDGSAIAFETGTGIADTTPYPANPRWNTMTPHVWDPSSPILPAGALDVWVVDDATGTLATTLAAALGAGVKLLLDTSPAGAAPAIPPQIVQITQVDPATDPLCSTPLAHITWQAADALAQARELRCTRVKGNLVPATQGLQQTESFVIGPATTGAAAPAPPAGVPTAIVRTGPNQTEQYLYTLGSAQLVWLPSTIDPTTPYTPEIQVTALPPAGAPSPATTPWAWWRSLVDTDVAADSTAYTVDPMRYVPVGVEIAGGAVNPDYDGSNGWTVRFGDGTFGQVPAPATVFQVVYRAGGGGVGNVAAGTITTLPPGGLLATLASAVTNPLPATGGADAQTAASVQQLAPEAYKTTQLTAVVPADFAAAAQTLPWVARAGSVSRYTGSWLTTFTTPEPVDASVVTHAEARRLEALLDQRRLAGRDSVVLSPTLFSLDLNVVVFAVPGAFRVNVQSAVREALGTGTFPDGSAGFFQHGKFTFGTPLVRSALEAAIQGANGVAGVVSITYRRTFSDAAYVDLPDQLNVGASRIIQVDNDPARPQAGSLAITVQGGR